jgi:hypothetical protein
MNKNDILLQLRNDLDAMIEIIDKYQTPLDEVIIIKKEDLTHLKWVRKINSYTHLFEYKNSIRFSLPDSGNSYQYAVGHYKKIMNGTLERLVLNIIEIAGDDLEENYKLEEWHKTKMRDLYTND